MFVGRATNYSIPRAVLLKSAESVHLSVGDMSSAQDPNNFPPIFISLPCGLPLLSKYPNGSDLGQPPKTQNPAAHTIRIGRMSRNGLP